eukprot:6821567-Pyramimonas_sp.AAC.1
MASKTAKMAPRCLQDGRRCTSDGPRRPNKRPPKRPKKASKRSSRKPRRGLFRRLKTAQEAPKIAHEASKMAP